MCCCWLGRWCGWVGRASLVCRIEGGMKRGHLDKERREIARRDLLLLLFVRLFFDSPFSSQAMSHLPSPPLSTSSAPPNPWWTPRQEDGLAHARQAMKLSIGSAAALDAAWLEGQPPKSPSPPSPGDLSPPKGSPPAEPMLALQVLARVVDSSKGRDKFLVRSPPPRGPCVAHHRI